MAEVRSPPYLPFLDGPAQVSPQLKPIGMDDWLLPDTEAADWLVPKHDLMRCQRENVFVQHEWAEDAADEAARTIQDAVGPGWGLHDFVTPLERAAAQVSDDLCVMVPVDGVYCLGAASLCAPTFWSLTEMAGRPLGGLHREVTGADPELSSRISRIFSGLQHGLVLERFNWTVQLDGERHLPSSQPLKEALKVLSAEEAARRLHLRVERQTVRKLPETRAVLFTIRICVDALTPVMKNETNRKAFRESWISTSDKLSVYKGWPHYASAVEWMMQTE